MIILLWLQCTMTFVYLVMVPLRAQSCMTKKQHTGSAKHMHSKDIQQCNRRNQTATQGLFQHLAKARSVSTPATEHNLLYYCKMHISSYCKGEPLTAPCARACDRQSTSS